MIQVGGLFLPDGETHLVEWIKRINHQVDGKLTYQYSKIEAALQYVKAWRNAIDVGAHCGLWSMHLVKRFDHVEAFEPVERHRECFLANVGAVDLVEIKQHRAHMRASDAAPAKATLHPVALGAEHGSIKIHTAPSSSGDSWVDGAGDIPMLRLDSYSYIKDVDFIKLDCEGYELYALQGGEELLKRCRPCVIVEQKPGRAQKFGLPERGAVDYLLKLGAKLRREMSGDFILSWDDER